MNEKFIKVEILIDTTKPQQVVALNSLIGAISLVTEPAPAGRIIPEASAESKTVTSKKGNVKPAPVPEAPAPEVSAEEETKPEAPATSTPEKKEYKIEEVREKLKEKVNDHREAIKAKLTELGAPNVSSLDPDNYPAFMDFLNGLK